MENGILKSVGQLLISFLLILFSSLNINGQQSKILDMNYRLITSKEGMDYLDSHHKSPQDFSATYRLKSNYGVIYELENGEVLLIHPIGVGQYPGFIFSNVSEFLKYRDADFFPIGTENMTWLEAHSNKMHSFLKDDSFYLLLLAQHLKVKVPFTSIKECEEAFERLKKYISKKSNNYNIQLDLVYCYALAFSKFLIEENGFKWVLRKQYEVYNPYYYPELSKDERKAINVISILFISIGGRNKGLFRDFYWHVTGIPLHVKND